MKDLLIKLKEVYDSGYADFLCLCAEEMYIDSGISLEDYHNLKDYMKDNVPEDTDTGCYHQPEDAWYHMCDRASRIKWLDKHIKLNS